MVRRTGEMWAVNATVQSRLHRFRKRNLQPLGARNFNITVAEASAINNGAVRFADVEQWGW
jgi:hypothetical protein